MGRVERHVEEERRLGPMFEPFDGFVREQVRRVAGHVEPGGVVVEVNVATCFGLAMCKVVRAAAEETEELVEAVGIGPELIAITEVPFAEHGGVITVRLEDSRHGGFGHRQAEFAALLEPFRIVVAAHVIEADCAFESADALLITAGHESATRGTAFRTVVVELGEADSGASDCVDVGSADIRGAVGLEVAPTEIVGQDQHDVGRALRALGEDCGYAHGKGSKEGASVHKIAIKNSIVIVYRLQ